jgi:FKBP-type peptidyl-prolyl cis-trans isomerase
MERIIRLALVTAGAIGTVACGVAGATPAEKLESPEAQQSYSLGVMIGEQARMGLGEVDQKAFLSGFSDAFAGEDTAMTQEQIAQALQDLDERRTLEVQAEITAVAEANRMAGDTYREEFGQDPEVVTLENGIQYKVLEEGDGAIPSADSTVMIHYKGMFVDGREFDSSYADDQPVSFPVDRVIPGWNEVLTRMPTGSTWQVVVPPEFAYGEQGAGGLIGPNSTLVFEMKLIATG